MKITFDNDPTTCESVLRVLADGKPITGPTGSNEGLDRIIEALNDPIIIARLRELLGQ